MMPSDILSEIIGRARDTRAGHVHAYVRAGIHNLATADTTVAMYSRIVPCSYDLAAWRVRKLTTFSPKLKPDLSFLSPPFSAPDPAPPHPNLRS